MPAATSSGEKPRSTGSNSGSSASLFFLMISRARSRDSNSCTWLVTASASSAARSSLRSPFGRRKTFSRPSIRMRASDLYRGRDQIDRGNREHGGNQGRDDDPVLVAQERLPQRAQIQIAGFEHRVRLVDGGRHVGGRCIAGRRRILRRPSRPTPCTCLHARTLNASHTPADATTLHELRRLHSIKVAAGLILPFCRWEDKEARPLRSCFVNHESS